MPCWHMLAFSRTLLCNKPAPWFAASGVTGSFQITVSLWKMNPWPGRPGSDPRENPSTDEPVAFLFAGNSMQWNETLRPWLHHARQFIYEIAGSARKILHSCGSFPCLVTSWNSNTGLRRWTEN